MLAGRGSVAGDRAGGTRVRRAGAAAVRRWSPQDNPCGRHASNCLKQVTRWDSS